MLLTLLMSIVAAAPAFRVWGMLSFSNSECPDLSDPQYDIVELNQQIRPNSEPAKFNYTSIKSFAWQYPIKEIQLEFYTGTKKYATIKGPPETRFLETFCGFKAQSDFEAQSNSPVIEIIIDQDVLDGLNGRIFQTAASYIKVVEKQ